MGLQHPAGEVLLDGVRLDTRLTASKDAGSEKLLHHPLGPLLGHKGHGVHCPLHAFPPLMSLSTRLWKRCAQFTVQLLHSSLRDFESVPLSGLSFLTFAKQGC